MNYLAGITILLVAVDVSAASDAMIAKFPEGFSRSAAALRATQTKQTTSEEIVRLAKAYLREGQEQGDARLVSIADQLLAPHLTNGVASAELLLTMARARSFAHDFESALQLLDAAILRETRGVEAQVQKASLLITFGQLEDARQIFRQHLTVAGDWRGMTLLRLVSSLSGQLEQSYAALRKQLENASAVSADQRAWA